tara:strand:- start:211 stop:549 length:339 start_codon:yes stop_codon:yes gene_type:complete
MKRMIGLVMMMGLVVGVGCGDDNNPVKFSNQDLVGTWSDGDGWELTFRSDGTFVNSDGDEGAWSLVGDQLTNSDIDGSGSYTHTLNSVTDTKLTMTYKDEFGQVTVTYTRKT